MHTTHLQPPLESMPQSSTLGDDALEWENLSYPAGTRNTDRIEEHNPGASSINVYEEMERNGQRSIVLRRIMTI